MKSYEIGDVVRTKYPAKSVFITGREADIKNDQPGYVGVVMTGHNKGMPTWGYDEQIGAVFRGTAKRAAEARQLQESYGGYGSKKHARRKKVEKILEDSASTTLWIAGGLGALWLYSRWKKSQTPTVSGLPPYQGPAPLPPFGR